ncbi:hypothetical protein H8957_017567, partial [Semnopithecus entellus]
ITSLFPSLPHLNFEQDFQNPVLIQVLVDAQDSTDEEEEASSISSSSCHFLFPSCSSCSSSSSSSILVLDAPEDEDMPAAGFPILPQSPLDEESSRQTVEDTPTWHASSDSESLLTCALDEKVAELVQLLLLKHQPKEPVTKAEMLTTVIKKYKDCFPMIFGKAHEFIELMIGIALTEMDPNNHSYVFENTVELRNQRRLSDGQGMSKNHLLIHILSVVFIKGSCETEEVIWEAFIYGKPRELLTIDWVQRKYLEHREVPKNSPPHYELFPRVFRQARQYHC